MTPFKGTNLETSPFRHPSRPSHNGIDITNPNGDWVVRETTGGTVTKIYFNNVRGKVIEVTTPAGDIERYQHLREVRVTVGQKVPQGTHIAVAGNTGSCEGAARADNEFLAGRHLHFEVLKGGKTFVNPSPWLGLPNAKGEYPGDDKIDGSSAAPPPSVTPPAGAKAIKVWASEGDMPKLMALIKEIQLPYEEV